MKKIDAADMLFGQQAVGQGSGGFVSVRGACGGKSVLEVIVLIIGLIVLRRDTLRSSALMGTISIVLAVLLDMVIPFHFG